MRKTESFPNGGFPPLYVCENKLKRLKSRQFDEEEANKLKFKTHGTSVSIKKIMEKRKEINPFIAV